MTLSSGSKASLAGWRECIVRRCVAVGEREVWSGFGMVTFSSSEVSLFCIGGRGLSCASADVPFPLAVMVV